MTSLVKHAAHDQTFSRDENIETKVKLVFIEYTLTDYGIVIAHYLGDVLRMNCNHSSFFYCGR